MSNEETGKSRLATPKKPVAVPKTPNSCDCSDVKRLCVTVKTRDQVVDTEVGKNDRPKPDNGKEGGLSSGPTTG